MSRGPVRWSTPRSTPGSPFDTVDTYGGGGGSERALGEVLGSAATGSCWPPSSATRPRTWATGPAAGAKGGRTYIRRAVEKSLRRLRTDYIDLYQLHTPDPVTPIDETLTALDELVAEGKVSYIGHSNFSGWQLADAAHLAARDGRTPFISAQNHWSLLEREAEAEVVPAARHFGVGVLPFFPLANGLLTGKVRRGQPIPAGTRLAEPRRGYVTDAKLEKVEELIAWAPGARRVDPGGRDRRPGRPARLLLGDRRGDVRRAGQGQRGRRGMDPRPPPN